MHVLAVLAAALLFGTTGTSQALGPAGTTPLSVGVMRMLIGGAGLAAVAFALAWRHARRHPRATAPARLDTRTLVLMALTGLCLAAYQPLFFVGTARNGVAVGTVVALGSAPVLAGVIEWALSRRRPTGVWMAATASATAGVIMLGFGGAAGAVSADPVGLVGSVGAGASFAVFANIQRRLLDAGWDPFTVVGAMGASSAAVAVVALPFVDVAWLGAPGGWAMALWLGLGTTSLAYVLFTWGLSGLTAATAATLTLFEPLTAGVLGIAVLGERLAPLAIAGLAVLAAALALLAWGSRAPRDPAPFAVEG